MHGSASLGGWRTLVTENWKLDELFGLVRFHRGSDRGTDRGIDLGTDRKVYGRGLQQKVYFLESNRYPKITPETSVVRACLNLFRPGWNGWNGTRLVVVRFIPSCLCPF